MERIRDRAVPKLFHRENYSERRGIETFDSRRNEVVLEDKIRAVGHRHHVIDGAIPLVCPRDFANAVVVCYNTENIAIVDTRNKARDIRVFRARAAHCTRIVVVRDYNFPTAGYIRNETRHIGGRPADFTRVVVLDERELAIGLTQDSCDQARIVVEDSGDHLAVVFTIHDGRCSRNTAYNASRRRISAYNFRTVDAIGDADCPVQVATKATRIGVPLYHAIRRGIGNGERAATVGNKTANDVRIGFQEALEMAAVHLKLRSRIADPSCSSRTLDRCHKAGHSILHTAKVGIIEGNFLDDDGPFGLQDRVVIPFVDFIEEGHRLLGCGNAVKAGYLVALAVELARERLYNFPRQELRHVRTVERAVFLEHVLVHHDICSKLAAYFGMVPIRHAVRPVHVCRKAVEFSRIRNRVAVVRFVKFRHFQLEPGRIIRLVAGIVRGNRRHGRALEFGVVVPARKQVAVEPHVVWEFKADTFRIDNRPAGIDGTAVRLVGYAEGPLQFCPVFLVARIHVGNGVNSFALEFGIVVPAHERGVFHVDILGKRLRETRDVAVEIRGVIALEGMERHLVFCRLRVLKLARKVRVGICTHVLAPDGAIFALPQDKRHRAVFEQAIGSRGAGEFPVGLRVQVVAVVNAHRRCA